MIKNVTKQENEIKAMVLSNPSEMLILGTKFLVKEKEIINYSEGIIYLDDLTIEIPDQYFSSITPEAKIIKEHEFLYSIKGNEERKKKEAFEKELKNNLRNIHKIALMKKSVHCIELKDDIPIKLKPYPTPIKIKDQVMKEIKILMSKSKFLANKIKYLGSRIDSKGIEPIIDYDRINNIKALKNKKECIRLLEYVNWFRPHILHLSTTLSNLTDKLKKRVGRFLWKKSSKCEIY